MSRIALITGATGGLGPAIVRGLAADGCAVVVHTRRRPEAAEALCAEIVAGGGRASPATFDVRDAGEVSRAVVRIAKEHGGLDVVVNNAGVLADGPFVMMDEDGWQDVVDTNLGGVFRVSRAAARAMMRRGGVIVQVASVAGVRASPMQANYAAAKAGILGLSRTLARELGERGIRVNTVIPGVIDAGMFARADARFTGALIERVPLGRAGSAEEVADAVVFLASDRARYVTGAELLVDGGLST